VIHNIKIQYKILLIYIRQPEPIVDRPIHIKRRKEHTQHCTILPHRQTRKERN